MCIAKFALAIVFAVAGIVLLADQRTAANAGIPLEALAGNYSSTCQGTLAICLNSATFAPADCGTGSPLVLPLTDLDVGSLTRDDDGNACNTGLGVDASLPVGKTPPSVSPIHSSVAKILNYDPAMGAGDISVSEYSGGKCIGSTFDNAGAKQTAAFVFHFAASNGGKRIDMIVTSAIAFVTGTTGNFFGGFSLACANLRQ